MSYKRYAKRSQPYSDSRDRLYKILQKYLGKTRIPSTYRLNKMKPGTYRPKLNPYSMKKTGYTLPQQRLSLPKPSPPPKGKYWSEPSPARIPHVSYDMAEVKEKLEELNKDTDQINVSMDEVRESMHKFLDDFASNPETRKILIDILVDRDMEFVESKADTQEPTNEKIDSNKSPQEQSSEPTRREVTEQEMEALYKDAKETGLFDKEKVEQSTEANNEKKIATSVTEATMENEPTDPAEVLDALSDEMKSIEASLKEETPTEADPLPEVLENYLYADVAMSDAIATLEQLEPTEIIEPTVEDESEVQG